MGDKNHALKIWCFGPETEGANVVVDTTVAVQFLNEIKEHVVSAFQWATKEGPICEEPMRATLYDITAPTEAQGGIYNCMNQRRGIIFHEEQHAGTNLMQMRAHLPVAESLGFSGALRQATSGQAFPQCSFSHWETMQCGDPMTAGSKLNELALAIRKRKGKKEELPALGDYLDKL